MQNDQRSKLWGTTKYGAGLGGEKSAIEGLCLLVVAIESGRSDGLQNLVSSWLERLCGWGI